MSPLAHARLQEEPRRLRPQAAATSRERAMRPGRPWPELVLPPGTQSCSFARSPSPQSCRSLVSRADQSRGLRPGQLLYTFVLARPATVQYHSRALAGSPPPPLETPSGVLRLA